MASDNEASCASDPNFAVICSFLECFGKSCGIVYPDIARLQEMLENTQEVPQQLIDLHIKLLRKTRKTVSPEKWERALVKFCHTYSIQDGWELERFGYKKARVAVKLRLLKVLLETQFDLNQKFKNEVNKLAAKELRVEPLGRDKSGLAYWCQLDEECNIRIYREDLDEENWELVAKDREGVVNLISTLTNGEDGDIPINEDSNSLEISEKPIIDTGQVTTSPSLEDEVVQENGVHVEDQNRKEIEKNEGDDFQEEQEQDDANEADDVEEEMEGEDEVTNDESSEPPAKNDDSQETMQNNTVELNCIQTPLSVSPSFLKSVNGKVDTLLESEAVTSEEKEMNSLQEVIASGASNVKPVETYKSEEHTGTNSLKDYAEESTPLKSIEIPVITSPLKLVNTPEMKQIHEDKATSGITPISTVLNITKKQEDSTEQVVRSLDKLLAKNNLSFPSTDTLTTHGKLSVKPIDQLAANLVRIQSEKLDKPSGVKSLEKIAENLARSSGSIVGNVVNGDDDRLQQDFYARSQTEKANTLRGHRGMDLSTSPRGWESANEQNRPMDFSGIDLSSRKFNKNIDLPSPGYRVQDFQHREMDLSTKKLNKPEVANLPYDARAVMMRNHAMVADLSKRQMPFPTYEMPSTPYHNAARIPSKEDHRLPNYTILPDPSKITALRMNTTPVKRSLEGDDMQQDMLKRIRADIIPIRGSMDKRSLISNNWRDEVGEAIEEPIMMIQGEGSGSDCDAVNPGLGEAIEEPVIFFYGEGSGEECQTGNPGDDTSADNKESNESKNEADSATSSLSSNKSSTEDSLINEVSTGSLVANKGTIKLSRNYPQSSDNVKGCCEVVGSTQEKPKFKPTLGVQIIPKNSSSSVKRLSRWDVGKPEEKTECDSSIISNERDISRKKSETECEDSTSENRDINIDGNSLNAENAALQERSAKLGNLQENVGESSAVQKSIVVQDSIQCDSSISLCQADTSETLESCAEATPHKDTTQTVYNSDSTVSHGTSTSEKVNNECKPVATSPPRFFFGPNCISYTSRSEVSESQSDHTVSTSMQSKSDTLQYECVSSSKPVEDMITSYKSDDFDVTQTNNNSLKIKSYTSQSDNSPCENDDKNRIKDIEEPTTAWEQKVSSKYSIEEEQCVISNAETNSSNSKSKVESGENLESSVTESVQDPISSSENTENKYLESEETEILDAIPQPHSTNDLSKDNLSMKLESTIVTPSVTQFNLSIESVQHENEQSCNTFEEQLQSKKSDLENNIVKDAKSSNPCLKDEEADSKSSDVSTLEESESKMDSVCVSRSCSSPLIQSSQSEIKDESNNSESDSVNAAELTTYQEVDSSAGKDVEDVSRRESDLSLESCSKQNDKNDNFSEFDRQPERSIDVDNEKGESQLSSDADLAYTNSDKNSAKINTLINIDTHEEVSENSKEMGEKTLVDSVIKSPVPDVNTELDFAENFAVTSSESIEQCNKDTLVPTISSSDDARIQDTSFCESAKMQLDSEKSSFKDEECPIYNVLPEIVPDTNNLKSSESDNVDTTEEMDLSNLIQPANEIENVILKGQSSCDAEELNVVTNEKSLESMEFSELQKEKEEIAEETLSHDKDVNDSSSELHSSSVKENKVNVFDVVSETEKMENVELVHTRQDFPNTAIESTISESEDMDQQRDVVNVTEEKYEQIKTHDSISITIDNSDNLKETNNVIKQSDVEEAKSDQLNMNSVNPPESVSEFKQSLVPNYDSSDSNDGSDDVFEPATVEFTDAKNICFNNLDETIVGNKQNKTENLEDSVAKSDILFNDIQNTFVNEQQTESSIANDINEMVNARVEWKQNQIDNEEITEKEHNCNILEYDTTSKSVTPTNENEMTDNSKKNDTMTLETTETLPISVETDSGNLCNQVNKECLSSTVNKANNLVDVIKAEDEKKDSVLNTDKLLNLVPEHISDSKQESSVNEIGILKQTNIDIQPNDASNEITHTDIKEQHIKPIEEKLMISLDNDIKFINSKTVEHVTEELSIVDPLKKLKELSEFRDKENKFDTNLHEEKHLNKELSEEVDASVHSVPNQLLMKFDNISSGIEKSEICQNNISTISEGFKPMDNLQFVNFMSERSENSDIMVNHEKSNESLCAVNKGIESFSGNTVSSMNDSTAIFTAQEVASESAIAKSDSKKEASKRLSDVSDIQDVPPLKSKPPYVESNEQVLENLTSSKVQLDKDLDSSKQVDVPISEAKISEDIISDTNVAQLTKDEFDADANVTDNILNKDNKKADIKDEEKTGSSEIQSVDVKEISLTSDDSMGADNENLFNTVSEDIDPLACTDEDTLKKLADEQTDSSAPKIGIRVKPVSELVYEGWKLDSTESPKVSRKRRNSSHDSNSEDTGTKQEDEEMMGGKRIKLRGKRIPDKQLRKSIEESRVVTISSEDEAVKCSPEKLEDQEVKDASDDQSITHSVAIERKARGRPRGRRRRGYRGNARIIRPKHSEFQSNQVTEVPSEIHLDGTTTTNDSLNMTPISQKKRKKRKMVLGLEVGRDIAEEHSGLTQNETPVRQSRRIAQLKIKEEADKRRIEEETLSEKQERKESTEKKKRKKQKPESEEEVIIKEIEKEKKSKKKRRKKKKKKMLAKFNEANPWQSSSGSSSDEENENDEDEDEEEELESEGSLLFRSDHEFSPESDLEKDQEPEPLRRARTAQKAQSDVEEADDEYACQKCGKADHPEWILLCDSCDKGWHCSCLRPALMLIPEGDWFCPPCQHNLLVVKLRDSLKTYDQLAKRHENEVLRKKRLAFVGISLDNVLHKNEAPHHERESRTSSQESDNESSSASSSMSSETSSSEESEPVYQLRERRCANRYKFNDYDDMINAAIQDEVEAVQGAGNQGRGKDIATIVNAEKEEAQLHFKNEVLNMDETQESKDNIDRKSEKDSDEEYKIEGEDGIDEEEEEHRGVVKRFLSRKKHRKLNSLDISSEDDPESDEDFKGTSSEEEEDFDDHLTSSDESTFADVKRRGRKGDPRSVRRSTRARTTRYEGDFIDDESEESDRPKRKKSRSTWDSDNEDSDNSWRQRKKKSKTIPTTRYKTLSKPKSRKKKKRKRIIESDNQSDNDDSNEETRFKTQYETQPQLENSESTMHEGLDIKLDNGNEINENKNISETNDTNLAEVSAGLPNVPTALPLEEITQQKKKKEGTAKPKKTPTIRRKIIYGGLPDENKPEEEEILSRRTRGRKINYQEEIASDSEEELKKALRRTGESEDEFVVKEGEDVDEDAEKDSDSGDIYNPKKDGHKLKNKSPKTRKPRKSKSPGGKRKMANDGTTKQRKKPGPKPGSKNKSRRQNFLIGSMIQKRDDQDLEKDIMANVIDNTIGEMDSKIDDNLSENVGLTGTTMSVAGSFTGDVPEGSLTGLGPGGLDDLDDEQLEQMMMEDEEYGRRQLELAAIEIAKKKKKEEREAKKLEKARLKALEILAAERQRDPNAPEGIDGEVPKKKKRGRRSKAEILAEQMRRDGAPNLNTTNLSSTIPPQNIPSSMSPTINPNMSTIMTPDAERSSEGHLTMMTGPDGQLFHPDGSPMKPKRRGRGKGKKTLALEAIRAAEAAAKSGVDVALLGMGTDSNPEMKPGDIPNVLPTPGSSTSGSAPSTPPAGVVTTQGPPSSQTPTPQSVYPSMPPNNQQQSSVITRMLQSQPVSSSPQSFSAAAAAMGHKYFGGPTTGGQIMAGPRTGYEMQPRGRIPSPYRQAGQSSIPPHFAAVRSGTPPMRMRVPGPQMYHTPHHPMDPSPSGGGPISINNRDRSSPLGPGPAMIPPAAGSPLAKGGPTPPPPPPYVRGPPPLSRFADNPMGPRHQMPPFTNASPVNHNMQQPSPPPNRPPGNFSPYHPPPPPNYHYGAYPPPPPMSTADDAAAYQGSPYPADHFSSPADNQPPIQAPPPPQHPPPQQQAHPNDTGAGNKQYDEEGSGEFGGLVSYFSSQREDDLDS